MNGRAYGEDLGAGVYEDDERDDGEPSTTAACPVCGKRTSVEFIGTPGHEWWCAPCNTAFPADGDVSAHWATKARKLRAAGHRPRQEEGEWPGAS